MEVSFVSQFGQEAGIINKPCLGLKTWERVGWAFRRIVGEGGQGGRWKISLTISLRWSLSERTSQPALGMRDPFSSN